LTQRVYLFIQLEACRSASTPRKTLKTSASTASRCAGAEDIDVETAFFRPENSQDYGEERWTAIGWLDALIYSLVLVFEPTTIRAISLRKATREERKDYAEHA
jgi:uncharacterized DUF497 family protein